MSLGLGHRYWVRMIKHKYGTLEDCIQFMKENKPNNNKQWFELKPDVKIRKGKQSTCEQYSVDLVEEA